MEKDIVQYVVLRVCAEERRRLREWLSGGVSPCQGEGRGFESRLALWKNPINYRVLFVFRDYRMFRNMTCVWNACFRKVQAFIKFGKVGKK